jgi:hypothetical protein
VHCLSSGYEIELLHRVTLPASVRTRLRYGSIDNRRAAAQLHEQLRRFRLDLTLSSIAKLWGELVEDLARPEERRRLWPAVQMHQLAYLAMAFVRSTNDYRGEPPSREDLFHITNLYNQAQGHEVVSKADDAKLVDFERFFLRTAYQQFTHQSPALKGQIERALHLFDEVARRPQISKLFDMPGEFASKTGLSIQEFMRLGLVVFTLTGGGKGAGRFFTTEELVAESPQVITSERLELFLGQSAASYTEIRNIADETEPAEPDYQFYRFNPLQARPVIRTQRSGYVVPFPPFVVRRITTSLYYDLMEVDSARFPVAFGMAFETYVWELLATEYGTGELFAEQMYGGKEEQKSTDWIVIESTVGTLVECKVARLTMETKVSADPDALRKDLIKGVVQALTQLDRVMRHIRTRAPGLEPFYELTDLVPIVLVLDPFFLANTPLVRAIVQEELKANGVVPFDYQILHVGQVEDALPLIKRRGFANLLRAKMKETADIVNGAAYIDFDSYLDQVEPGGRASVPIF